MKHATSLKFVKLNKRHTGAERYPYRIEFLSGLPFNRSKPFISLRNYLLSTYGESCELELINAYAIKPEWCWCIKDKWKYLIYTDENVCTHIMLIKEKFERNWIYENL